MSAKRSSEFFFFLSLAARRPLLRSGSDGANLGRPRCGNDSLTSPHQNYRYYSSLRTAGIVNQTGQSPESGDLTSCGDAVLTTLAQAGVYQTGTDRALISLFDADYQYIIAEATATTRLQPSLKSTDSEKLWLCGTAIPRKHGVCEHSLLGGPSDAPESHNDGSGELPLTLSDDLVADPRFSCKPYCQPGTLCRFYAAVPIRTRRGINIGVYCVINETPGVQWTDDHTQRLRDISRNIMEHFESKRLEVLYRRNIRMNRGLGSFIEGESTLVGLPKVAPRILGLTDEPDVEGALNATQQALLETESPDHVDCTTPLGLVATPEDQPPSAKKVEDDSYFTSPAQKNRKPSEDSSSMSDDTNPASILSKAANLLRESMEVEGCVLVDATTEAYRAPVQTAPGHDSIEQPATSSSDDSPDHTSSGQPLRHCSILGFSTSVKSSVNGDAPSLFSTALPEKFLAKLLRRYPQGKIFNFGADGVLQSSDSSDDDSNRTKPLDQDQNDDNLSKSVQGKLPSKPWARQREGTILSKAFPGARCVAFTPVWDQRKDRWYAGGFVYSNDPARHFTEEDELSYLRAFGILTMAEILRNMDLQADKAKSDVLGSLSHELRSPLHGVILSAELLGETKLSVFQGNAAHTIEICSRTLLDTIDHLLDYSKVNSFSRKKSFQGKNRKTRPRGASQSVAALDDSAQNGEKNLACISQLDGLIEEVIESVFAGYTFQFLSVTQSTPKQPQPAAAAAGENNRSGPISIRTVAEFEPVPTETAKLSQEFGDLSVILSIDPRQNWSYFVQVGAIRRIVMNIFGNALKYTSKGTIRVTLAQDIVSIQHRKKERVVRFTVEDTGKGIGEDFLRHGLFRPFSQEDTLSPGTGLGLSLVKRIVTELRGDVSIKSQAGVGTTVSVVLPLEQVPRSPEQALVGSDTDKTFIDQIKDLKGLRVGLSLSKQYQDSNISDWHTAVHNICNDWLTMEIVSKISGANAPDLMLWSHDSLPTSSKELKALAKTPNVVLCPNALVAYNHSSAFDAADHSAIFEFVSQPYVLPIAMSLLPLANSLSQYWPAKTCSSIASCIHAMDERLRLSSIYPGYSRYTQATKWPLSSNNRFQCSHAETAAS